MGVMRMPLWDKKAYIAYKMVTPGPKSLHRLQDKNEKLSQCFQKKSERKQATYESYKIYP